LSFLFIPSPFFISKWERGPKGEGIRNKMIIFRGPIGSIENKGKGYSPDE
jgi:hypothetical protein